MALYVICIIWTAFTLNLVDYDNKVHQQANPRLQGCVISHYAVWHELDNERILAMVIPDSWSSVWARDKDSPGPGHPGPGLRRNWQFLTKPEKGRSQSHPVPLHQICLRKKLDCCCCSQLILIIKPHNMHVHIYWYEMHAMPQFTFTSYS